MKTAIHLLLSIALSLTFLGCASSPQELETATSASEVDCDTAHETCKDRCSNVDDAGSRGPCFAGCMKRLEACKGK